jgi:ribonuclease HII
VPPVRPPVDVPPTERPLRVLGIDEAGRGSALGPLVVGGFLTTEDRLPALRDLGVKDSKQLTPEARARIYRALPRLGRRFSIALLPTDIDGAVRERGLNRLEASAFARLLVRSRAEVAYVDACDPVAERFGRVVRALAGTGAVVHARHHADRDLPVVGAASIVAKVERDRAIARLRRSLGAEIGSGYPSDERTVAWIAATLAGGTAPVAWLRYSWRTVERVKPPVRVEPLESFAP